MTQSRWPAIEVKPSAKCGDNMAKELKTLQIQLVKSPLGRKPNQRKTVKALGLRKLNQVVELEATPSVLGMVNTVSHLVEVKEIS